VTAAAAVPVAAPRSSRLWAFLAFLTRSTTPVGLAELCRPVEHCVAEPAACVKGEFDAEAIAAHWAAPFPLGEQLRWKPLTAMPRQESEHAALWDQIPHQRCRIQ
jgi:hypothetical protein